jgi:hypothetical protein
MSLLSGADGRSKVVVTRRGAEVAGIIVPLVTPVTVRLINSETAVCWETVYNGIDMLANQAGRFKAKIEP